LEGSSAKSREFLLWPSALGFGLLLAFVLVLAVPNGFVRGLFIVGPLLALITAVILLIAGWVAIESLACSKQLSLLTSPLT